ncbi:thioredoxin reductase [Micromonospora zhanjiangensis]|uniref:Thioredoxin reductase n=1 Tax=Micromonospora zhanjiangensis TaxID=1522057 RepID=A0ABV8KV04_9ACTN
MADLQYKMIMALSAADLGGPLCEQVAGICAEIAEQHCADLRHVPAVPGGEIDQLATGEPALAWGPATVRVTGEPR